ncbi:hypothetical protein ACFWVU_14450 [Streptomyces sp. NPDC058686]|uniref:hypothetical protein n=1 Tax=Streptomyces sp. NPDC058686 TaxID=3346599 RepID=UPI00364802DB
MGEELMIRSRRTRRASTRVSAVAFGQLAQGFSEAKTVSQDQLTDRAEHNQRSAVPEPVSSTEVTLAASDTQDDASPAPEGQMESEVHEEALVSDLTPAS